MRTKDQNEKISCINISILDKINKFNLGNVTLV